MDARPASKTDVAILSWRMTPPQLLGCSTPSLHHSVHDTPSDPNSPRPHTRRQLKPWQVELSADAPVVLALEHLHPLRGELLGRMADQHDTDVGRGRRSLVVLQPAVLQKSFRGWGGLGFQRVGLGAAPAPKRHPSHEDQTLSSGSQRPRPKTSRWRKVAVRKTNEVCISHRGGGREVVAGGEHVSVGVLLQVGDGVAHPHGVHVRH